MFLQELGSRFQERHAFLSRLAVTNRINFEPYQPPKSLLHGLVVTEGEPVLIHGIDLEGPTPGLRMVLRWCGGYWVDVDWGAHFDGPFPTLAVAMAQAAVVELVPGCEHVTWLSE